MAATLKVPTIFTATDKISSIVKNMGRNVQSFADKMQSGISKGNRLFRKLTPSIGEAGKQLLSFISAASIASGIFAGISFGTQSIMDYEVALHSLEAVTGVSSAKMKGQIEDIAKRTKKSAIDVAASYETIGSAMSQYLDNPKALGQITEAGITLAKASRQELQPTLENLTSVMNQFKLGAEEANKTINILTAGEIVGSVSTAKIAASLQAFGANAYTANVKLSESVALLEVLGKQMDHSKIDVGARNLLNVMASAKGLPKEAIDSLKKHKVNLDLLMDSSKPLGVRLKELSKIQGDAVAITNVFGKENMTAANVIFGNLSTYDKWAEEIEKTNKANEQAAKNSDTLKNRIDEVKNSFVNAMVSGDKLNPTLEKIKNALIWVAENMQSVLSWTLRLIAAIAIFKGILLSAQIIMSAYNIALGISSALSTTASVAIGRNAIALAAYNITTKAAAAATWLWSGAVKAYTAALGISSALSTTASVAIGRNAIALAAYNITTKAAAAATWLWSGAVKAYTAAQWLLNAAMTANPIGLIIAAVLILIGIIALVISKWEEWGAALSLFLGPIGLVISIIQSFRRNWDMVVNAFKTGGILGALKAIGRVLLDALLMPVQQLLSLLSKVPGMANLASKGVDKIQQMRESLGVNTEKPALSSAEVKQGQVTNENINTTNNRLDINLNDPGGNVKSTKNKGPLPIPVRTTKTSGQR